MAAKVERSMKLGPRESKKVITASKKDGRTIDDLLKLVKEFGPVEATKTLSESELAMAVQDYVAVKKEKKTIGDKYDALRLLIFENAKFAGWKMKVAGENTAEITPSKSYHITPSNLLAVIAEACKTMTAKQRKAVIDTVLKVKVTESRTNFTQIMLDNHGGEWKEEEFGNLVVS